MLLIVLAEAITHYRRAILARIAELRLLVDTVDTHPVHRPSTPASTHAPIELPTAIAKPVPAARPLVICGGGAVFPLAVHPASTPDRDGLQGGRRLSTEEAAEVIRECFEGGDRIAEAAVKSTRSTSYVHKVYGRLANPEEPGPRLMAVGGEG